VNSMVMSLERSLHDLYVWPECGATLLGGATGSKEVPSSNWFVRRQALWQAGPKTGPGCNRRRRDTAVIAPGYRLRREHT
jgi:hypothetical protein